MGEEDKERKKKKNAGDFLQSHVFSASLHYCSFISVAGTDKGNVGEVLRKADNSANKSGL